MKATATLHDRGQSLWLDNITRELLETGTLRRYIDELSVTGLTDLFRPVWEATAGVDGGEDEAQLAGRSAR